MSDKLVYDLAFVGPKRRPRTAPEIVFIIDEPRMPEVVERLFVMKKRFADHADDYLGDDEADFSLPVPDLFGNREFGYGNCGYWTVEDRKVHLRLQLRPYPWTHYCSLTISLLTMALSFPYEDKTYNNRQQDISLMVMCDRFREVGYGHAVGGWISESVLNWLKDYAKGKIKNLGAVTAAPMHPEVISAEQATWHAISSPNMQSYASRRHIYGWVRDSGAFSLNCFGNACDLGVYPERWLGEGCGFVELGCHNLDRSDQQLTLLAGLAKICELARET